MSDRDPHPDPAADIRSDIRSDAGPTTADPDPHRPRFHLTPRSGWLNDPNGVIHHDGRYHLFYQHNPARAAWGPPHWAHVVSDDLVHWQELPVAITPDQPPADDGGCWSGCAVLDDGVPVLVYTGVKAGEQCTCLAFGDEQLLRWRKHPGNPVARIPDDRGVTQRSYRDPFVWREGGRWYQVIGTSLEDRGQVLLYASDDLRRWECLGPLLAPEVRAAYPDDSHTWECPNFFALGDKHVLLVSLATPEALAYPVAFVGEFRDHRFVPERRQRFDWGFHCFYAPLTMRDPRGRRLVWGWLQEQRPADALLAAGWAGAMSLPRELTLDPAGRLRSAFVPELQRLRTREVRASGVVVRERWPLPDLHGHTLELRLALERGEAARSGVLLQHAPDDTTRLWVDWRAGTLTIDRPGCSGDGALAWKDRSGRFEGWNERSDRVDLHLFVDHSTVEAIADGTLCLSARTYPRALGRGGVALFAEGGAARVPEVRGWHLKPIH